MQKLEIKIVHEDAVIPEYKTEGAAAIDLQVMIPSGKCCDNLVPGSPMLYGTGVAVAIPEGYVGVLSIRSGKAHKGSLKLSNGIGVIDSDYRGEIKISLWTDNPGGCSISHGERVAQLMVIPAPQFEIEVVEELSETVRGDGGYGHTGA